MTLAADLLEQAQHLAAREQGRPKQASLRRAISTAYYSMFHLLVDDASRYLVASSRLRPAVARSFEHQAVRAAAEAIGAISRSPNSNHWVRSHLNDPISADLTSICDTFVDLQKHRHKADYDIGIKFTRLQTNDVVSSAHLAHALWRRERNSHNAHVFMLAGARLLGSR